MRRSSALSESGQSYPRLRVLLSICRPAEADGVEVEAAGVNQPPATTVMRLRVDVAAGAGCRFAGRGDGVTFTSIGEAFQATLSKSVGAQAGLFASAAPGASPGAAEHAAFDCFRIG